LNRVILEESSEAGDKEVDRTVYYDHNSDSDGGTSM
jgi:hypothetical protein